MIQAGMRQLAALGALVLTSAPARAQVCEGARPTQSGAPQGSYGAAPVDHYDSASGRARVHYARSGPHAPPAAASLEPDVPDAVVVAAQAADDALAKFDELGYLAPLSDQASPCSANGDSEAVDIYLMNFSAADGQAVVDHCQEGTPTRCAGFVLVENDFKSGGYADTAEGLRTVVPHELFHLVQHAYDVDVEPWWAEGSAQWAAKQVYPELRDLERFLPAYFDNPWRPLNVPPSGPITDFLYATAIWPVYLSERFDPAIVREVFEQFAQSRDGAFPATQQVLAARGSSLEQEFLAFAAANAATAERAPAEGGYQHAADYPLLELTPFTLSAGNELMEVASGLGAFYYSVSTPTPVGLELEQGDVKRVEAMLLPVVDGQAQVANSRPLQGSFRGDGIIVVAGQSLARVDAPFTLRVTSVKPNLPGEGDDDEQPDSSGCALSRKPGAHSKLGPGLAIAAMLGLGASIRRRRQRKDA
jgi:hypothetical protein